MLFRSKGVAEALRRQDMFDEINVETREEEDAAEEATAEETTAD